MALNDLELSLMAFPQSWNATTQQLSVNLLMLPVGSPLTPLGTGPQFGGTTVYLKVSFIAGLAALPSTTSLIALSLPYVATPPVGAVSLLESLPGRLAPGTTISTAAPNALASTVRILKSLPTSYTQAFPFERPASTDIIFGDWLRSGRSVSGAVVSDAATSAARDHDLGRTHRLRLASAAARHGGWPHLSSNVECSCCNSSKWWLALLLIGHLRRNTPVGGRLQRQSR